MHMSSVDPGFNGNPASANAPQHEQEVADLASMWLDIMPGDDDPCALLSHEGASVTVQSAPSDSAPSDSTHQQPSASEATPLVQIPQASQQ